MDDVVVGVGGLCVMLVFCAILIALISGASWSIGVLVEWLRCQRAGKQYLEDVAEAEAEAQRWRIRQQWLDIAIDLVYFVAETSWQATEREESEEIDD